MAPFTAHARADMMDLLGDAGNRLALHSAAPATPANELTGGSYARQPVLWTTTPTGGLNGRGVQFRVPPGRVQTVAVWTADHGGELLAWAVPSNPTTFGTAGLFDITGYCRFADDPNKAPVDPEAYVGSALVSAASTITTRGTATGEDQPVIEATLTTAAQIRARAADSPGKNFIVAPGSYGDIDFSGVRPAAQVTFIAQPGQEDQVHYGVFSFASTQRLAFDGGLMSNVFIFEATNATNLANAHLRFWNLDIGGHGTRYPTFAAVNVQANTNDVEFDNCTVGWTQISRPFQEGDSGFSFRLVNGDRGPIDNFRVTNTKVIYSACDAFQIAGVTNFLLDTFEINFCSQYPEDQDVHGDTFQVLSIGGDSVIRNGIVRNAGFLYEGHTPGDGYPCGNFLIHGFTREGALVENVLFVNNRNYHPSWKIESDGLRSSNWKFRNVTVLRQGPPQVTEERAINHAGTNTLFQNCILDRFGSNGGTVDPASGGNLVRHGSMPNGVTNAELTFNADWECTSHPVGYRKPEGAWW